MKTTILLMFSLFLITRSLLGQIHKFNYIDSDIKKQAFITITPKSPRLSRPNLNVHQNLDSPTKGNLNRFNLYQDYGNQPSLRPVTKEKLIKKTFTMHSTIIYQNILFAPRKLNKMVNLIRLKEDIAAGFINKYHFISALYPIF